MSFWLNVSVIFTLFVSLLTPAVTLAETTEASAGVVLTQAKVTEEGVSLKWETNAGSIPPESSQSFQVVKNDQAAEVSAVKLEEESTETTKVYQYVDESNIDASQLNYQIVWSIDNQIFTSNTITINAAPEESEETQEEAVSETDDPVSEEEELPESVTPESDLEASNQEEQQVEVEKDLSEKTASIEEAGTLEDSFLYVDQTFINENSFGVYWWGYVDRNKGRVSQYELYLDGKLTKTTNTRDTEYTFTDLQADTSYEVTVKALNSSNEILLEETIEVTTYPMPSGVKAVIADANLKKAIKDQLRITRDIYESDMVKLTSLDAVGYGITSLAGLEKAVNLVMLAIYDNNISDITPLASLTKLEYLDIEENNIKNIQPLQSLTNLHTLWLSYNPIKNIQPLQTLKSIEVLYLHETLITNIDVLLELPYLTHLTLEGTNLDLSEGSAASKVLATLLDAGVYIDIAGNDDLYDYLEVYAYGASEESIHLNWWYNFRDEADYEKAYTYKIYVNGVPYQQTMENEIVISGLDPETKYEILIEMYDEKGVMFTDALAFAETLPMPSGEIISIPDKMLRAAIRENLFLPNRDIYESDMERLEMLFAPGYGIKSLKGLEAAIYLEYLSVEENEISDLSPLKNLEFLSYLSIAGNNVKSLQPLKGLYLYFLDISDNPITDISDLGAISDLEVLFMHYLPVKDISTLLELENLQLVTLFGMENLTFEPGTPEMLVVEELISRGVEVILNEDDFYGSSDIAFNVLDITTNSIELEWDYEGEEEVAYYEVMIDQETVDFVEDGYYHFTNLTADTTYDIAVMAYDEDGFPIDFNEIKLKTAIEKADKEEQNKNNPPPAGKNPDKDTKKDKNEDKNTSSDTKKGNKLPVTATNTLNYIFAGLGLLLLGLIALIIARRNRLA